ncbi:hypothetical protein EV426DRAFT_596944 [Tirmania nivea]|nr:hypothetical protein EV426DRAFT_596944 [Tirmania nivea]
MQKWRHIQQPRDYGYPFRSSRAIPISGALATALRPPNPPAPPSPVPEPSAPTMSIAYFLSLSFLVNTPVYFFIYALSSLFLVQYVCLPAPIVSFITYIGSFFFLPIIGFLFTVLIIFPCLLLAFTTSHISSFIQSFLDVPINKNTFPSLLDYCVKFLSQSFELIPIIIVSIPLLLVALFHSILTSALYIISNPSCIICFPEVILSIWSFVRFQFDPYAYLFLYNLPGRFAYLVLGLVLEPWKITQFLAEIAKSVLLLIGIPVNELGKGVSWIGRKLAKTGGAGHFMGVRQRGSDGLLVGVLLIVGYMMLDWMKGLTLSRLKDFVV